MRISRSCFVLFSVLLVVLPMFVLTGCSERQEPASRTKLRLALNPVPQAALVILAKENGFFDSEGLDVEVSKFTTGKLAFDAVLGGAADVATVADVPIMYAAMSGQRPAVLATIERSGKSVKLLARSDQGIHTPADIRGKKIGTFKASSAEFFLTRFLAKHGMRPRDVAIVHLQPPDLVAGVVRGDLAAISIWEPHIFNAQSQLPGKNVVFTDPELYTETFNMACQADFLEANRKTLTSLLRALRRAERTLSESPDKARATVATFVQMDEKVLTGIWPAFDFRLNLDPVLPVQLKAEAEFAVAGGSIPQPTHFPDFQAIVRPEILQSADAMK